MSNPAPDFYAHRQWTTSAPDRWQALQTRLSMHTASAASHWSRRSFASCRWRALPAGVSVAAFTGMA